MKRNLLAAGVFVLGSVCLVAPAISNMLNEGTLEVKPISSGIEFKTTESKIFRHSLVKEVNIMRISPRGIEVDGYRDYDTGNYR